MILKPGFRSTAATRPHSRRHLAEVVGSTSGLACWSTLQATPHNTRHLAKQYLKHYGASLGTIG